MVRINVGDEVPILESKFGTKNDREWMMFRVMSENGKESLTCFVSNASEAKNFTQAKIVKILGVEKRAHQYNGKWYDQFSATVVLDGVDGNAGKKAAGFERFQSAVASTQKPQSGNDFVTIPDDVSDDGLPFA